MDPLGYVDGANLFEYSRSSPMSHADPYGLDPSIGRLRHRLSNVNDRIAKLREQLANARKHRDALKSALERINNAKSQIEDAWSGYFNAWINLPAGMSLKNFCSHMMDTLDAAKARLAQMAESVQRDLDDQNHRVDDVFGDWLEATHERTSLRHQILEAEQAQTSAVDKAIQVMVPLAMATCPIDPFKWFKGVRLLKEIVDDALFAKELVEAEGADKLGVLTNELVRRMVGEASKSEHKGRGFGGDDD